MRSTLRSLALAPVLMAAAALALPNVAAAETLKVPFQFTADGKVFPAGNYRVEEGAARNLITLRSADGSRGYTWITRPGGSDGAGHLVILKFDRWQDRHALRSIQYDNQVTPRLDKHTAPGEEVSVSATIGVDRGR